MRKLLCSLIILFTCCFNASSQILNSGFESWNSGIPENWWGLLFPPYNIFSQSTNSHSGNYAVNLHTDTIGGTAFSSPLSSGNGSGITTHPLTFVPGSVTFWYRLIAFGGDQITLTGVVYSGGIGKGVISQSFPATSNYTQVSSTILYNNIPPNADSIALIFTLTNPSGIQNAGTDVLIDDVSVSVTSAVNEIAAPSLQIYPNPGTDYIYVKPVGVNKYSSFSVIDLHGKVLIKNDAFSDQQTISIRELADGLYIFRIDTGS